MCRLETRHRHSYLAVGRDDLFLAAAKGLYKADCHRCGMFAPLLLFLCLLLCTAPALIYCDRALISTAASQGGIVDGRGLAAALNLGCDGVSMGTRFYATHEALGRSDHKCAIVGATCDTAIRTRVFDTIQNSYSANPWPAPYDSMGVLHNDTSKVWDADVLCLEGEIGRQGPTGPIVTEYRVRGGDVRTAAVLMGQGAADVRDIESATNVVIRVEREAIDAIERAAAMVHRVS